jgi:hypothetical protein
MAGAFQGTTAQVPGSMSSGVPGVAPADTVTRRTTSGRCARCERFHMGQPCSAGGVQGISQAGG